MKLFYTPRSHYARKVRILLDAYETPYDLTDVGDASQISDHNFGPNPLMKVPTLVDGEVFVFESDHIAEYIVRRFDPEDRFGVLDPDILLRNARAVMNGVMVSEVETILARRSGIDTQGLPRFSKHMETIHKGLDWLESVADTLPKGPSYTGFHLVCMLDHLLLYKLINPTYPKLLSQHSRLSALPFVARSYPE